MKQTRGRDVLRLSQPVDRLMNDVLQDVLLTRLGIAGPGVLPRHLDEP